jgi:hypothetical protein
MSDFTAKMMKALRMSIRHGLAQTSNNGRSIVEFAST